MTTDSAAAPTRTINVPWKTALGLLGSAAFGLTIGALLAAFIAIQFFGYKVATVQSFSMEPTLDRGDLIVSRPVSIMDVKAGQVILFEEGTQVRLLVAHRVDGVMSVTTNVNNTTTGQVTTQHSRVLRTKGDANPSPDAAPVDATRLRGRLWFTLPKIGLVLHRVPLQAVLLGVAAATAIAWVGYELQRRGRRRADGPD
jgi:signal peptidase